MSEVVGYIIDDGNMFEGTLEQFANCFFTNNDEYTVRDWCEQEGYKFEVIYGKE